MTYEKDSTLIVGLEAHGSSTIKSEVLEEALTECSDALSTEQHRNCAALINDSFFVSNTEGQFILRVSAIEALCDQTGVDERFKEVVESLEQHLRSLSMDDTTRETIARRLKDLKRKSLRQSYMEKFRTLLSQQAASDYDQLYRLRSKFLHEGLGRGTLSDASNRALSLAVALYKAELFANQGDLS